MSNNNGADGYEDITNNRKLVKTAKMAIGESFNGTLVAIENSTKYPDKQNLVMEDAEGNEFLVHASGNLSYAIKDGKLEVGQTYLVTRLESVTTKKGATRTQFRIQRRKADGSAAEPTVSNAKPAGKGGAGRGANGAATKNV